MQRHLELYENYSHNDLGKVHEACVLLCSTHFINMLALRLHLWPWTNWQMVKHPQRDSMALSLPRHSEILSQSGLLDTTLRTKDLLKPFGLASLWDEGSILNVYVSLFPICLITDLDVYVFVSLLVLMVFCASLNVFCNIFTFLPRFSTTAPIFLTHFEILDITLIYYLLLFWYIISIYLLTDLSLICV